MGFGEDSVLELTKVKNGTISFSYYLFEDEFICSVPIDKNILNFINEYLYIIQYENVCSKYTNLKGDIIQIENKNDNIINLLISVNDFEILNIDFERNHLNELISFINSFFKIL